MQRRSHAPDYFAWLADGSALVLDCRSADRIKPRDRVAFEATGAACTVLGWRYEVVDAAVPVLMSNLRWLAGCRHPQHQLPGVAAALREVFADPRGLLEGAEVVGDPIAVLPVLFHLLWQRELHAELLLPLHPDAVVGRWQALGRQVLRAGDRVAFDGEEHVIVGLAGTSVRLRADSGGHQVVLATHLMGAADFAVLADGDEHVSLPAVEPLGLLAALPEEPTRVGSPGRIRHHHGRIGRLQVRY